MSPKLPRITGREVLRALRRAGWVEDRQEGSHVVLRHGDRPGRRVTVAVHAGETLKPKTLSSILDQAGLSIDAFRELL
jgi:predicted RNA binding protein YcfA (HicA-like mRNA interferase family)